MPILAEIEAPDAQFKSRKPAPPPPPVEIDRDELFRDALRRRKQAAEDLAEFRKRSTAVATIDVAALEREIATLPVEDLNTLIEADIAHEQIKLKAQIARDLKERIAYRFYDAGGQALRDSEKLVPACITMGARQVERTRETFPENRYIIAACDVAAAALDKLKSTIVDDYPAAVSKILSALADAVARHSDPKDEKAIGWSRAIGAFRVEGQPSLPTEHLNPSH